MTDDSTRDPDFGCRHVPACESYLDIETSYEGEITVVGIYVPAPGPGLVQLVGAEISAEAIAALLPPCSTIFTFNGHTFDLPAIRSQFGLDLRGSRPTVDLMRCARRRGLRGGLKRIETRLGIGREGCESVDGRAAMRLWKDVCRGDDEALHLLLAYNAYDVCNLVKLRQALLKLDEPSLFSRG